MTDLKANQYGQLHRSQSKQSQLGKQYDIEKAKKSGLQNEQQISPNQQEGCCQTIKKKLQNCTDVLANYFECLRVFSQQKLEQLKRKAQEIEQSQLDDQSQLKSKNGKKQKNRTKSNIQSQASINNDHQQENQKYSQLQNKSVTKSQLEQTGHKNRKNYLLDYNELPVSNYSTDQRLKFTKKYSQTFSRSYSERRNKFGYTFQQVEIQRQRQYLRKEKNFWEEFKRFICCRGGNYMEEIQQKQLQTTGSQHNWTQSVKSNKQPSLSSGKNKNVGKQQNIFLFEQNPYASPHLQQVQNEPQQIVFTKHGKKVNKNLKVINNSHTNSNPNLNLTTNGNSYSTNTTTQNIYNNYTHNNNSNSNNNNVYNSETNTPQNNIIQNSEARKISSRLGVDTELLIKRKEYEQKNQQEYQYEQRNRQQMEQNGYNYNNNYNYDSHNNNNNNNSYQQPNTNVSKISYDGVAKTRNDKKNKISKMMQNMQNQNQQQFVDNQVVFDNHNNNNINNNGNSDNMNHNTYNNQNNTNSTSNQFGTEGNGQYNSYKDNHANDYNNQYNTNNMNNGSNYGNESNQNSSIANEGNYQRVKKNKNAKAKLSNNASHDGQDETIPNYNTNLYSNEGDHNEYNQHNQQGNYNQNNDQNNNRMGGNKVSSNHLIIKQNPSNYQKSTNSNNNKIKRLSSYDEIPNIQFNKPSTQNSGNTNNGNQYHDNSHANDSYEHDNSHGNHRYPKDRDDSHIEDQPHSQTLNQSSFMNQYTRNNHSISYDPTGEDMTNSGFKKKRKVKKNLKNMLQLQPTGKDDDVIVFQDNGDIQSFNANTNTNTNKNAIQNKITVNTNNNYNNDNNYNSAVSLPAQSSNISGMNSNSGIAQSSVHLQQAMNKKKKNKRKNLIVQVEEDDQDIVDLENL